jgi:hypothetical protein
MNNKFDELTKSLAQSVTCRGAEEIRRRPRRHGAGLLWVGEQRRACTEMCFGLSTREVLHRGCRFREFPQRFKSSCEFADLAMTIH